MSGYQSRFCIGVVRPRDREPRRHFMASPSCQPLYRILESGQEETEVSRHTKKCIITHTSYSAAYSHNTAAEATPPPAQNPSATCHPAGPQDPGASKTAQHWRIALQLRPQRPLTTRTRRSGASWGSPSPLRNMLAATVHADLRACRSIILGAGFRSI